MPLIRRSGDRTRPPIPKHPYRDTAVVYGVMAGVLVVVAALTGGDVARAAVVAVAFFFVATAWSWWRFRERIREQAARAARDASGSQVQEGGE
jgi:membrane protein implicated in regulation of membrane protease activity